MAVGQQSVGIIVVKNLRLKLQVLELLDVQLDLMSYRGHHGPSEIRD